MAVTSILVYTDGEVIGDGILRLTFAQSLKAAAPDATITWLSSGYSVYENVLKDLAAPLIDELIVLPERRMKLHEFFYGPARLRRRKFDLIIDTQRNFKRSFWLTRIGHRRFISASSDQFFSSQKSNVPFSPHFLARLLQLGALGLGQTLTTAPLPLPAGDWAAQAKQLLPDGARYVGFSVGAGHPDKCWCRDKFIALAQHVTTQGFVPVFFVGPQDHDKLEALQKAFPQALFPLNTATTASPYLTIALSARLTAAVANDSGGGHLIAAANTPLVSLFRCPTVRTKFLPASTTIVALAPQDFDAKTTQEIPLEAVKEALDSILKA